MGGSGALAAAAEPSFGLLRPDGNGGYAGYAAIEGTLRPELTHAEERAGALDPAFTLRGTVGRSDRIPDPADARTLIAKVEAHGIPIEEP